MKLMGKAHVKNRDGEKLEGSLFLCRPGCSFSGDARCLSPSLVSPDPQMGPYIAVREGWWPSRGSHLSQTLGETRLDGMTSMEPS